MPSFKQKFSGKEYAVARKAVENLTGFLPRQEQYVACRMDGQSPEGKTVVVKLYNNGTLFFQTGSDAALAWALGQFPKTLGLQGASGAPKSASVKSSVLTYPHVGTDESGKGDYFGPLVVCGVLIPDEATCTELKQQGVRDGKTVTDTQIAQLSGLIHTILPENAISLWVRQPTAYNAAIEKANAHGQKLNHVLACGHGTVISELAQHYPNTTTAMVDQFAQNTSLVTRAAAHAGCPPTVTIVQETKAESHVAVAAASIVARHVFLTSLADLGQPYDTTLPKGAGGRVNTIAKRIAQQHGVDTLKTLVKWHFKNSQSIH